MMVDVKHGFVNVLHPMSENVDGHHRHCNAVDHVRGVGVVHPEVLPEAQRFGFEPGFLHFNENHTFLAVIVANGGGEVDSENREGVACGVGVLVWAQFHFHHILFQQSGKYGSCHTLVFHQVLEDDVVYGVGDFHVMLGFISEGKDKHFFLNRCSNKVKS